MGRPNLSNNQVSVPDDEEEENGRESDEGYFGVTETCSCNLQLKLCTDRLYYFIMYFKNTMGMPHLKVNVFT